MKTFIQNGDIITVTAPSNVTSGNGVLVGSIFGIVTADGVAGDDIEIATTGVFKLSKLSTAVIAQGDPVSWNGTTGKVMIPATGMYPIGIATVSAANGTTTNHSAA